jgi:hypothetical protein
VTDEPPTDSADHNQQPKDQDLARQTDEHHRAADSDHAAEKDLCRALSLEEISMFSKRLSRCTYLWRQVGVGLSKIEAIHIGVER